MFSRSANSSGSVFSKILPSRVPRTCARCLYRPGSTAAWAASVVQRWLTPKYAVSPVAPAAAGAGDSSRRTQHPHAEHMRDCMQRLVAELRSLPASELNWALTALLPPSADRPSRFFIWDLLHAIAWVPADTHLPAPKFTAPSTVDSSVASEPLAEAGFVQLKMAILDLLTHERLHELQLPARAVLICALYCAGRRARLALPAFHGHGHVSRQSGAVPGRHGHHHAHGPGHQPAAHGQLLFRRSLSPRFASAIASVLLGTGGLDLSRLKDAINVCGATDMFELMYSDLEEASPTLLLQLLQHFGAEAALLRASRGSPLGRQIISDVDDTLISGWLESRYTRGKAIPGAVELVRALRSHSCTAADGSRVRPLLSPNWWLAEQALQPWLTVSASGAGSSAPTLTPMRVDDVDRADAAFAPPASVVRRLLNRLRSKRSSAATATSTALDTPAALASEPPPPFSVDARQMDSLEAMARELEELATATATATAASRADSEPTTGVASAGQPEGQPDPLPRQPDAHATAAGGSVGSVIAEEAVLVDALAGDATHTHGSHPSHPSHPSRHGGHTDRHWNAETATAVSHHFGFALGSDRDSGGAVAGGEPPALQLLESLPSPSAVAFDVKRKKLRALEALSDPDAPQAASGTGSEAVTQPEWQWQHDGHFPSSIVLVTARPANLRGLLKRRTLQSVGALPLRCHVLALLGSLRASTSTSAIVGKKLDNAMRAAALFPELDLVLLGDTGQGDAAVYAHVLRRLSASAGASAGQRQRAHAFLHHVNPEAASELAPAVSGDGADIAATYGSMHATAAGLHVCGTWAEAAAVAAEQSLGLISLASAKNVAVASLAQLEAQLQEEQEQRRRDALQQQRQQANAEGSKRSRLRLGRGLLHVSSTGTAASPADATSGGADPAKPNLDAHPRVDVDSLGAAHRAIVSRLQQLIADDDGRR